ncbi:MAG: triose-phosphate isomerase [Hydrogenophilus sp.]|nr:triose-phosphate isomerase [Hydrogenophilus sp.]
MKYVIGNWKSNGRWEENARLLTRVRELPRPGVEVGVCVPFPYLAQAREALVGSAARFGAQNVSPFGAGAYTGEVHAEMLREFGCHYAIVGHSERRQYFGESDAVIADKIGRLVAVGITPIWCIGETLAERQAGKWQEVLARQVREVVERAGVDSVGHCLLAYEPVWAIGTGINAEPEDVEAAHAWVRSLLREVGVREHVPILYGGSVKSGNAHALFSVPGCDGGLIGGASLSADEFAAIAAAA